MFRVDAGRPDLMKQRSGGGGLILFGLPFMAVGLGVLGMALGFIPVKQPPPLPVGILFGVVFSGAGILLMLGRMGCVIDRHHGTITTWWGLLVPFRSRVERLDGITDVWLSSEMRRSNNATYRVFPVRLGGDVEDGRSVLLEEPRDYQRARQQSESLAKFLNLAMRDSTSGQEVFREAGTLDESLAHRLLRTGEALELPDTPADMKTHMLRKGHSVMFDIPPPGFSPATVGMIFFGVVIALVVSLVFVVPILLDGKMPAMAKVLVVIFLGGFFVLMPLVGIAGSAVSAAKKRVRLIVDSDVLRVEELGIFRTQRQKIPVKELEELEIQEVPHSEDKEVPQVLLSIAAQPILARSDNMSLVFGGHLDMAEKKYLLAVMKRVVAGKSL